MPVKTGTIGSNDYMISKDAVNTLDVGQSIILQVDNYKRVQKYLYEIGLKCKPDRREFRTKKIDYNTLDVIRAK